MSFDVTMSHEVTTIYSIQLFGVYTFNINTVLFKSQASCIVISTIIHFHYIALN